MLLILAALILVPLAEIALFIVVGDRIGLWPTLGVIVATAVAGAFLLRHQGLQTLRAAQTTMSRGQAPVRHLAEGLLLFFAGALLLTPGLLTDAVGFALLIPPVRALAAGRLMSTLARRADVHVTIDGSVVGRSSGPPGGHGPNGPSPNGPGDDMRPDPNADDGEAGVPPLSNSQWGPHRRR